MAVRTVRAKIPSSSQQDQRQRNGLWQTIAHHAHQKRNPDAVQAPGLWSALAQRTDLAQSCPQRHADVTEETLSEGAQTFLVLRSPTGAYVRLTEAEAVLWHAMDGTQTVAQLAALGFRRFKQLLPVADLVQSLKQQDFLTDAPAQIYQQLQRELQRHSAEGRGRQLLAALRQRTFPIPGVDQALSWLYRTVGWLCFSRLFLLVHILVSIAGLGAFMLAAGRDAHVYQVLGASTTAGVTLDLLLLWGALLCSFVLHETAHGLAVKHYGRTVWSGGVMLYYGMPAAFVDTSDIWLAGRRARILVSAAGPLSDLLVGGGAALLAYAWPDMWFSGPAYTLAFACYIATLFNLNPLLELDGYYMLVDALRLPNLRRHALAFVSGPLWSKLRAGASFDREERIFSLYGLLTAVYTLVAIVFALLFWQRQLVTVLGQLWASGWVGQLLAVLLLIGGVVPIMLGLFLVAWMLLRNGAAWVERRGYSRRPGVVASILLALVVILALLPLRFDATLQNPFAPAIAWLAPLLWGVALLALLAVRPDYQGADVRHVLNGLLGANALMLLAAVGQAFGSVDLVALWMGLEGSALLLIILAGFAALLDVDLHQAPRRELSLTALLVVAAFGLGGMAIYRAETVLADQPYGLILVAAAPVYFGVVALALLLPHLFGLADSRLRWCWLPVWAGVGVQTGAYALNLEPMARQLASSLSLSVLAAGLWATAWCVHYVTLQNLTPEDLPGEDAAPAHTEAERLQRGFQRSYGTCYRLLRAIYGARRAQALDDRIDVLAATANWEVTLDRDQARISPTLAAQSLDVQGVRYAEVLRYAVKIIEEIAGARFARRTIQAAYDALPWPEREAADRRCFPHTPWAHDLSRSFGDTHSPRLRLLRQVDLFVACDDAELTALVSTLQVRHVPAGYEILAPKVKPTGIWIVEAGEVAVWQDHTVVDELHRGASFGVEEHTALASDAAASVATPSDARYRATVASTLLFLPTAEFRHLLREYTPHAAEALDTIATLHLLERIPLFAEMPRQMLRRLAQAARCEEVPQRQIVVRQGQPNGLFYIVKQGRAAIVARIQDPNGTSPRQTRVVSRLGPEEYFGEIELLRGEAPVTNVVSLTPMVLLVLPHEVVRALVLRSTSATRKIEQVGSGRLLDLHAQINGQ